MKRIALWAVLLAGAVGILALAETAPVQQSAPATSSTPVPLSPPTIGWGSQNQKPAPVQQIGYDSSSGQPCIIGSAPTCGTPLTGGAITATVTAKTVTATVTPTVTAGSTYGTNFVVGGLLTFNGAFQAAGSGIVQSAKV